MNAQEYILNIRPGYGYSQTVKVSQDDIGRPLEFHLYDGMDLLSITVGSVITIHATKPSGLGFTESCTWSGSTASISTTESMTQESGAFPAELVITSGGDVLGTANFTFCVERSPHPDGTTDGTKEELDDLYTEVNQLKEDLSHIAGVPNTVREAIYTLLSKAVYTETGLTDEKAIVAEWASTHATAIALSENSITFTAAGTHQLTAILTPSDTTDTPTWQSSDTTVATVSETGLVTTVGNGSCTIYATIGQLAASCSVSVSGVITTYAITNTLTKCTNSNSAIAIAEGEDYSATLTAVTGYTLIGATVLITMGGVDITSTAYNNGTITINDVDGAIEITAEAVLKGTNLMTAVNSTNWNISQRMTVSGVDGNDFTGYVPDGTYGYNWNANMMQKGLTLKSDVLADKTIFMEFDIEISGAAEGDKFILNTCAYDRANPTSGNQRKGAASLDASETGHYSLEIAASETTIQQSSSYYLGIMMFFYGQTGFTAKLKNLVATYY